MSYLGSNGNPIQLLVYHLNAQFPMSMTGKYIYKKNVFDVSNVGLSDYGQRARDLLQISNNAFQTGVTCNQLLSYTCNSTVISQTRYGPARVLLYLGMTWRPCPRKFSALTVRGVVRCFTSFWKMLSLLFFEHVLKLCQTGTITVEDFATIASEGCVTR